MTTVRPAWFALPLLLLLAGCASTPEKRIEQNQKVFDALPVAAQARIRGGQIDLGYTPDMVRIAFGEPQRRLVRRSSLGDAEIWLYLGVDRRFDRQRADIDGLSVSGPGGSRSVTGSAWVNVAQEREFIRLRAEFQNGAVSAIEEPLQDQPKP